MFFMIYDTAHLDKGCFYSGLAKRKKKLRGKACAFESRGVQRETV
jgi:hypothetical protein